MEIITPQDYPDNARKRQRRSLRACDACRKRKTRCITKDGDSNCVHCQLRTTACTFQHDPPERQATDGASSNGDGPYSSDERHGLDEQQGPGRQGQSSSLVRKESRDETRTRVSETQSVQSYLSPAETRASGDSTRHHQAPSIIVPELIEPNPLDLVLGCSTSRFAELYGLGSHMEPILMGHYPYDALSHEFSLETHAIPRVLEHDNGQEYPLTFHMAADEKAVEPDPTHSLVDAIEACIRPYGPSLLELFWRHSVLPQHSRRPARAVYLSATHWWTYAPELSIRAPPDAAPLRKMLRTALVSSYHRPKLYSIQTALLLLQCQPEDPLNPDHTFQWGLTCQALAIGQCLGLHHDATKWTIPQWERNVRKRLSWALFMQDRWTALAYGRPVHIHDDDWTVEDITPTDFTDYDGDRSAATPGSDDDIALVGTAQYIQMVQLTKILSVVYSTFYTARTCREQDTVILFKKARPLFDRLTNWYHRNPPTLQMNIIYQRKLCFHGYLHFSYHGVAMTLLRRLIRSTSLPPRCTDECVLYEIRQIAVQTAQSAISFVTNLHPDHLEAFWYLTSPYLFSLLGSFTALLLITSLTPQERHLWQETLNSYLWKLRIMSKSHEHMGYAVNRLEGAILRGLEHALAANLNECFNAKYSPMTYEYAAGIYQSDNFLGWSFNGSVNSPYGFSGVTAQSDFLRLPGEDLG